MGGRQYIRSHRHSWWPPRPPWLTLMSVLLFVNLAYTSITCGPGIKSAGGKNANNNFSFYTLDNIKTLRK